MSTRRLLVLRLALITAAAALILALFLPIVFFFAPISSGYVGGVASPWDYSPLLATIVATSLGGVLGWAALRPNNYLRFPLFMSGTTLGVGCIAALLYTFLWSAGAGFHPYGVTAALIGAILLVFAAFFAEGRWFQFRIHTLLVWAWFAALICAFLRP